MKKLLLIIAILAGGITASAQTDATAKDVQALAKDSRKALEADSANPWKFSGMLSLTASQTSLKNWAAGGDQQIGMNSLANFNANYAKGKHSWQNTILGQYGTLKLKDKYDEFRKTDDKLQFASKYGYAISKKWYYSCIFDYKSQFTNSWSYNGDGEKDKVTSGWWSPLYLTYTLGFDYQPNEHFTIYLSPMCGKTTVVTNDELAEAGAFGVEKGDHSRSEFGWYMRANASYNLTKMASLNTNVTLFSNYKDGLVDEVDIDWNLILTFQINKWLAFNFTSELIYDEDITIKEADTDIERNSLVQFKDVIGVGLTFKF